MSIRPDSLTPANLAYLEDLYELYRSDPSSVPAEYRDAFAAIERAPSTAQVPLPTGDGTRELRISELVEAYRTYGHRSASLDPLSDPPPLRPELDPATYGFSQADLDTEFAMGGLFGLERAPLRELVARLRNTYCRTIGVELTHIDEAEIARWVYEQIESTQNRPTVSRDDRLKLLTKLTDAEVFEQFLHTNFLGAKRFSLEGAETLIPLLDLVIEEASNAGVEDIVVGMAHRGRLNVLANVVGKPVAEIFREFDDRDAESMLGRGDVKYHLGYARDIVSDSGKKVHISLAFNPSHLEAIYPVVQGRVRAKQDRLDDMARVRGMALVLHGDAAFSAQGVVAETLNLSEIHGYRVGGTVHVVINNQLGFTTNPEEGRSSVYATGMARMLDVPIFHVNGEDPEAVVQVVKLAVAFRHRFHKDAVIDMYCYRKYGHNEGDEPDYTQPAMYARIKRRPSVRQVYARRLLESGIIQPREAEEIRARRRARLEEELTRSRNDASPRKRTPDAIAGPARTTLASIWAKYRGGRDSDCARTHTGVEREPLERLGLKLAALPEGFQAHPKVRQLLDRRREMARGERPLDWGMAELLSWATLLDEGTRVRLSGQDSARGTFSHRHAVFYDTRDGSAFSPLQHLSGKQGPFEVRNSPLSEYGVLGFEYGYSLDYPDALVMWEAQFGDFANTAQVIIDQFLCSAEDKWARLSGLVLLLPHGFEGQGPEHSTARLDRFLTLSAEDNWQVCNVTTPAQYFHVLRRQVVRPWRKPLVLLTPKSLLRHPEVTSSLEDLNGEFRRVIGDTTANREKVQRILLCSGKVYYDLKLAREKRGADDTAIVRVEQLYPFPKAELWTEIRKYPNAKKLVWVQEEPRNMGSWHFVRARALADAESQRIVLEGVSRPESSSPATGSNKAHHIEQQLLIDAAFGSEGPASETTAEEDTGPGEAPRPRPRAEAREKISAASIQNGKLQ